MVWSFKSQDENNYNLLLRSNLCKFKDIFQYVYSIVYSDIYWSTERRGFDLKSLFQLLFKVYKDKKKAELGKDPSSYKDKNYHFKFEQKPVETDSFNEIEDEKMRVKIEKRKQKRRELAEKNKALKQRKRRDENEAEEKQLWERLDSLNKEFKAVKDIKK